MILAFWRLFQVVEADTGDRERQSGGRWKRASCHYSVTGRQFLGDLIILADRSWPRNDLLCVLEWDVNPSVHSVYVSATYFI